MRQNATVLSSFSNCLIRRLSRIWWRVNLPQTHSSNDSSTPSGLSANSERRRRRRSRESVGGSIAVQPAQRILAVLTLFCCALPLAAWAQGAGWVRTLVLAGLLVPVLLQAAGNLLGRGPRAPRQLNWDGQGRFSLYLADGTLEPVLLQPASRASARWIWLVLRGSNRYSLFLDRQAADPADFAALRRQLRTFPSSAGL